MTLNSFVMEWALKEAANRYWKSDSKRKELHKKLDNVQAGMSGERKVLDVLRSVELPEESRILHDLNLPLPGGQQFQVDILALLHSGVILLETKQIAGRLKFCTSPAALHKLDEYGQVTTAMECPAAQLQDQIGNLAALLYKHGFPVPITGRVVFANHPIIEQIPPNLPVIKSRELRRLIRSKLMEPRSMTGKDIDDVAMFLQRQQIRYFPFPFCEREGFNRNDFYLGPLCKCWSKLIKQTERAWKCPACGLTVQDPYEETLLAYFLLVSRRITVKQCMELLSLKSSTHARNILNRLAVKKVGSGKQTEYELDYELQFLRLLQREGTRVMLLGEKDYSN